MIQRGPTVSIGLPVYNGLPFLEEALQGLLAQTFEDFEVIVSDNASDDGTADVCADFARRDPRIRFFRKRCNVGAAENYNHVFREARGRYFKWAAADDICRPTFLERCIAVLECRPEVVLCYPKTQFIDAHGLLATDYEDNMHVDDASAVRRFRHVIHTLRRANCVFGVIRTESLRQTGLIGAFPASDAVLLAELAIRGRFHEVPERLFLRRIHEGQSMQAYRTFCERAVWFHPERAGGRLFPLWRKLGEYARSIHRSPLPWHARVACHLQLPSWVYCRHKMFLKELAVGCLLFARRFNT